MKVEYLFETKKYNTSWCNQNIHVEYNGCICSIDIKVNYCKIEIYGLIKEDIDKCFYAIWEILALYDGYFYRPIKYLIDGIEYKADSLYRVKMYKTSKEWIDSAVLLGRNSRSFSNEIIDQYILLRNQDRENGKLTRTVLNSFFYLHSEAYEEVLIEHKLSILLNLCDGVCINIFNKESNKIEASISNILRYLDVKKAKHGAELLNVPKSKFFAMLTDERHELDHYICKTNSVSSFVSNNSSNELLYYYSVYIIELALKVCILECIGFYVCDEIKEYAINEILDWIIKSRKIDQRCYNPLNQLRQELIKYLNDVV